MNPEDLFVPPSPRPSRAPRWAVYSATVDTAVRLTWADRLRALIGGAVVVRVWIALEKKPGRINADARIYTDPLVRKNIIPFPVPPRENPPVSCDS